MAQSVFQYRKPTEKALPNIRYKLSQNVENKECTIEFFLHIQKVFHKIQLYISQTKMSRYGVRGLHKNYMGHDYRDVTLGNFTSNK